MARQHIIPITNGQGSKNIVNGTYTVTSQTTGYDNTTILPIQQEIVEGTNNYTFTITATGTLTLHVTNDGTESGVPIVGASFVRCDVQGTTYGDEIITNELGNALFNAVPFSTLENTPIIYYKQTSSDGEHIFDNTLKNTTLTTESETLEIANADAQTRNFNYTDANYDGLPIANGQITFTEI